MPKNWDGIVSRHINRKLSRPLAKFLAKYPSIKPNHVTVLSLLSALASCLAFYLLQPILGGVLAQFSSILDGVDGDLATITNRVSSFGGYLDALLDRYGDSAILAGMTYYIFATEALSVIGVLIGIAALTGSLMVSYSRVLAESNLNITFTGGFADYAANRDVRLFIIMFGGIFVAVFPTIAILAVLTNTVVLARILHAKKATEKCKFLGDLLRRPTSIRNGLLG
ncbi:MAG: CDP-alcohol phosphatidyltransferase family protein [Candidatus Bathyarchaeia archaeon]